MRFRTVSIFLVVLLALFFLGGAASQEVVRITHAGVTVQVPSEFLIQRSHFDWIDGAEGLDAEASSFRIRVPLRYLLGSEQYPDGDITAAVFLSSDNEVRSSRDERLRILGEIVRGDRGYDEAVIEPLGINGWFKVTPTPGLDMWDVLKRRPEYYETHELTSDALIARCGSPELVEQPLCNTMISGDSVVVHLSFSGDLLNALPEIIDAFKCELATWIVASQGTNDQ